MKNNQIPEVRFPKFEDAWEQRKLGDILHVSKEKNKNNQYLKEQVLSVSREVGTVNQIEYQGRSFAGADISGYKVVHPGQMIYTKSPLKGAPYGIFQNVTIEGIVSPLYAVYNSTERAMASFIGLQLKSDNLATRYLAPLVSKGAKNTINITDQDVLNGEVMYPSTPEQIQIVSFFKQLDDTITLHQRKLEALKRTKQGFLQKMFPKEGEQVPEVRFPGFTDDWELCKFIDIVDRVNFSSNSNELPKVEFEDIVAGEGRLNKDITKKFDIRKGTIFQPNNILYGKLRPYLKNWLQPSFKGIALGDFWVFEAKNTDAKFDYYLIQADKYQKVANDTSGTKMPRSDWRLVSNTSFLIPKKDEQTKIGTFFKQLDETVALHQRELEILKNTKKAFLQKMFV